MKIGKIYAAGKVSEAVAEFQLFKFSFPDPKKLIGETQTAVVSKQLLRKDSFCPLLASFAKVISK